MTIEEHARDREAAWLAAHPDGHEYEGKDLLMEAMEELADCWNGERTMKQRPALKGISAPARYPTACVNYPKGTKENTSDYP